jgi:single-strand DNA-binding protein
MDFNRVMLAGRLTRDPQVKFLSNEKAVANFGLAISRKFKGADGQQSEETIFIDVEAWGRTAELVGQYLTKGKSAFIEGRLKLDTWEKDGQKQSRLRVVADSVLFLSPSERAAQQEQAEPRQAPTRPTRTTPTETEDQAPF